jgi:uncharacterized protein (DUF1778 family)
MWRPATQSAAGAYGRKAMAYTTRITVRVTPEQRARIAMGAALAGQPISAFMRTAALESAERVIARSDFLARTDAHLATATRHPAGTTDRLRADDRERPY